MNFVGKIFVVLQLVFSVTLVGLAAAVFTSQTNWKTYAEDVQEDLAQKTSEYNALSSQKTEAEQQMTQQIDDLKDRNEKLEAERDRIKQLHEGAEQQLSSANVESSKQSQLAKVNQEQAKYRKAEADEQRKVNEKLHKTLEEKTNELQQVKNALFDANIRIEEMTKRYDRLYSDFVLAKKLLAKNEIEFDPRDPAAVGDVKPKTLVVGHVERTQMSTNNDTLYVEISLGTDDGIAEGHDLFVYRVNGKLGERPKYLGKIRVVHVETDRSVGTLIEPVQIGEIKRGDNVTTKL